MPDKKGTGKKLDYERISTLAIRTALGILVIAGIVGAVTLGVGKPIVEGFEKIGTGVTAGASAFSMALMYVADRASKKA